MNKLLEKVGPLNYCPVKWIPLCNHDALGDDGFLIRRKEENLYSVRHVNFTAGDMMRRREECFVVGGDGAQKYSIFRIVDNYLVEYKEV